MPYLQKWHVKGHHVSAGASFVIALLRRAVKPCRDSTCNPASTPTPNNKPLHQQPLRTCPGQSNPSQPRAHTALHAGWAYQAMCMNAAWLWQQDWLRELRQLLLLSLMHLPYSLPHTGDLTPGHHPAHRASPDCPIALACRCPSSQPMLAYQAASLASLHAIPVQ